MQEWKKQNRKEIFYDAAGTGSYSSLQIVRQYEVSASEGYER
jgi:hypothetical protein